MLHKRWFAFFMILSMVIAVLNPRISYSQTVLFDIQGHWAQPCIEQIVQKQIIQEYEDGTFRPNLPVTRAEFAYAIDKAFRTAPKVREPIEFVDIPANFWAGDAIRQAYQTGFLSPYLNEIFNPLRKMTREQVLQALVNGLKYAPSQPAEKTLSAAFDDAKEIPNNSRNAIAAATEKQLVVNYPNVKNLKPNQLVTRAEVAAFLCQAMGSSQLIPSEYIAKIEQPTINTSQVEQQRTEETKVNHNTIEATPQTTASPKPTIAVNPPITQPIATENLSPKAVAVNSPITLPSPTATENLSPKPRIEVEKTTSDRPNETTFTSENSPTIPTTKPFELRGVWITNIDSDVMFDRDRLTSAIERLAQLNFNTIYPTVWNWGYTLYPSKTAEKVLGTKVRLVTPLDENLDPNLGQDRDVLQEIIAVSHKKGIAVIPWFEFGFMAPADSEIVKVHPDWILQRRDGSKIWIEGPHQRVWLNPFRPEVQQFIQNLVLEIVSNYDVDGIQFDDHFGFPSEFGYDNYTVELYKKEHDGQSPPDDRQDPEWIRWRAEKITAYMQQLHQAIKQQKPKALVSISPNPQEFSYKFYLADWDRWEQLGLIDELVLQVYRNDINTFIRELERPEVRVVRDRIPVSIGIITGVKPQPIPMSQIEEQVQVVRDRSFAGVSFFFYESLWKLTKEPPTLRQSGLMKLFPTRMQRPNFIANGQPIGYRY